MMETNKIGAGCLELSQGRIIYNGVDKVAFIIRNENSSMDQMKKQRN